MSPAQNSIMSYGQSKFFWVIAIFMVIFGINFNIFFLAIMGNFGRILKNEELKTYIALCLCATAAIAIANLGVYENVGECIRSAFFHVSATMSTTGFVTAEFTAWSSFAQTVIALLMVIGACAGSTAGGLKISRLIIVAKSAVRELRHTRRPNSVNAVRLDGSVVKDETVRAVSSYVCIYVIVIAVSTLLLSFDGYSFETNFGVSLTTVNNVGPSIGEIGAFGSLASYSYFSKLVMCFNMLLGRLELMPMLILFSPRTWKRG